MTDSQPAVSEHGEQTVPYEWGEARWGDERFIVRDVPEGMAELYRVIKTSRNARVLARAEAVLFRGSVVTPQYEPAYQRVEFYHDWGGYMDACPIDGWLTEPAFVLERLHVATSILDFPEVKQ